MRASLVAGLVLLVVVAACGGGASFDPNGPCTADGQVPGAYGNLEARIPVQFDGRPPDRLDSGRSCTDRGLGTLAARGIDEVRFAGGLWETGERSGLTLAILSAPALTRDLVTEFYRAGALAGRKTEDVELDEIEGDNGTYPRIDTLNDQSFQSIVILDDPSEGLVRVVLAASDVHDVERSAHEDLVARAVRAWEPGDAGG